LPQSDHFTSPGVGIEGLVWAAGGELRLQAAVRAMTITIARPTRTVTDSNIEGS
jgi:hypothetical protein